MEMYLRLILTVTLTLIGLFGFSHVKGLAAAPVQPRLVAYYAGWASYSGREVAHIDASKITHLNYAFANIGLDGRIAVGDATVDTLKLFPGDDFSSPFHGNFNQLRLLKEEYPHMKTLIAVGGWSWSGRFSDVALTEESRRRFAESVVDFIVRFGFDGVDIDWEYPVSGGLAGNARRPEDKVNFTLLMQELRSQLDAQAEKDGRPYLLMFAGAAATYYTNNVELHLLQEVVDFVNIMTYDLTGPWEAATGLNSPLSRVMGAPNQPGWSAYDAVQLYHSRGVPLEKIVLGVPFYGYRFQGVANENNGFNQRFSEAAAITYGSLRPLLESGAFERHWHEGAQVPYLFDGSTFISYDDPESMRAKGKGIRDLGLGGAMVWEISQDSADGELLTSLHQGLRGLSEWGSTGKGLPEDEGDVLVTEQDEE